MTRQRTTKAAELARLGRRRAIYAMALCECDRRIADAKDEVRRAGAALALARWMGERFAAAKAAASAPAGRRRAGKAEV